MQRLRIFSADRYKTDTHSTSRLSPHVHYGEISVRHIYYVVRMAAHVLFPDAYNDGTCSTSVLSPHVHYRGLAPGTPTPWCSWVH